MEEPGNLQLILLAIVQGLTEFLPISSSAHLILASELAGWPDQGLSFDIAVHAGTLLALCLHLRPELAAMLAAPFNRRSGAGGYRLWLLCILGSLPLLLVGLVARLWVEELRHVSVIAVANLLFAAVLWRSWVRRSEDGTSLEQLSLSSVFVVGLWQCLAIIPGASRSGVTLTGGLLLGLRPAAAIRLSFLLALPAIAASALAELPRWSQAAAVSPYQAVFGAVIAGLTAWVVLRLFTGWVRRVGMLPFVVYRLLLGGILVVWLLAPRQMPAQVAQALLQGETLFYTGLLG